MAMESQDSELEKGYNARLPGSAQVNMSPLSVSLWRDKTNGDKMSDASARLVWMDLSVTVAGKGPILHGLTGYAEQGSILAIMGPSGSGKSTLLDALSGRLAKNTSQAGRIFLNGHQRTTLSYGTAAYVTQTDDLTGTLTVKETLYYSANLRLPDRMSRAEREAIVEGTLHEMGLHDCADTPVGNWHLRGLSGGERRRLSIALEILIRPRLLFLDEPTSGLDSAAACFVATTLRNLARDGRTVIASIHQPSTEVFKLFDNLYLLSGGQTIYFGEAASAREHFAATGFPCPPLCNPSDHYLRAINADFDQVKSTRLQAAVKISDVQIVDPLDKLSAQQLVRILVDAYQNSDYAIAAVSKAHEISQILGTVVEYRGSHASFLKQSFTLTRRSFVNMSRDIGYYWLRLVLFLLLGICLGTIFWKVGFHFSSIMARAGCLFFVAGFMTALAIGSFPSFAEDMKVFTRERLNGHYGVVAFVIGNSISSLPFLLLTSFVAGSLVYFMAQLHSGFSHYAYFILSLFAQLACVESVMMAVASVVPNFLVGIVVGSGLQGLFLVVAGFFRLIDDLPKAVWRYPLSYIAFQMYALQGMFKNDFLGLTFDSLDGTGPRTPGSYVVEKLYGIKNKRGKWQDLSILFGMIFVYRLVFFVSIKYKEKVGPMIRSFQAQQRTRKKQPSEIQIVIRPVAASPSPIHSQACCMQADKYAIL